MPSTLFTGGRGQKRRRISLEEMEEMIRATNGNIKQAEREYGIHNTAFYKRLKKEESLRKALEEAREESKDIIPAPKKKPRTPLFVTDESIKDALFASRGVALKAAEILGMKERAIYDRLHKNRDLKAYQQECLMTMLEKSENGLLTHVEDNSLDACKFVISKLGYLKGYSPDSGVSVNVNNISATYNNKIDLSRLDKEELRLFEKLMEKIIIVDSDFVS